MMVSHMTEAPSRILSLMTYAFWNHVLMSYRLYWIMMDPDRHIFSSMIFLWTYIADTHWIEYVRINYWKYINWIEYMRKHYDWWGDTTTYGLTHAKAESSISRCHSLYKNSLLSDWVSDHL